MEVVHVHSCVYIRFKNEIEITEKHTTCRLKSFAILWTITPFMHACMESTRNWTPCHCRSLYPWDSGRPPHSRCNRYLPWLHSHYLPGQPWTPGHLLRKIRWRSVPGSRCHCVRCPKPVPCMGVMWHHVRKQKTYNYIYNEYNVCLPAYIATMHSCIWHAWKDPQATVMIWRLIERGQIWCEGGEKHHLDKYLNMRRGWAVGMHGS